METVRTKETTYTIWRSIQVMDEDGKLRWEKEIESTGAYEFMQSIDEVHEWFRKFTNGTPRHETIQKAVALKQPIKVKGDGTYWVTSKSKWIQMLK